MSILFTCRGELIKALQRDLKVLDIIQFKSNVINFSIQYIDGELLVATDGGQWLVVTMAEDWWLDRGWAKWQPVVDNWWL